MQVTSKGGGSKSASVKQRFWLFKLTRRQFDDVTIKIGDASDIMDRCFKIRGNGIHNTPQPDIDHLVVLMKTYYDDWDISELNLEYIPSGASTKKKPKKPVEDQPEQANEPASDNFPYGQGDQHQEDASDADPYSTLPNSAQEKIKEIENILKKKAAQQEAENATESAEDAPDDVVEPQDDVPVQPVYPGLPKEFIPPADFGYWVDLAQNNINFMLVGPSGCGKTYPAQMIAKVMGMDSFVCSFSGGVRYSQVFGSTKIQDGETRFEPSELLQHIQEPVLIILDEAMSADADITIGLNSVTEPNQRFINTPAGRIDVHPECRFIATANNKGRSQSRSYIGAQVQDGSILDRFGVKFDVDYDENVERSIALRYLPRSKANTLISKIKKLREKLRQSEIHFDPSTRRLETCCKQMKLIKGMTAAKAFETTFLTSLSHAERATIGM